MKYSEIPAEVKHFYQYPATVEQIEEYTEKVKNKQVICNLPPPCSNCNETADSFKPHETRDRQFYVVVDNMVNVVSGLLIRWECPKCGKTFTDYPDFILPYKCYTLQTIIEYTKMYVEDDTTTYRKIIQQNSVGYPDSENQMEYSTIHKWISTIGSFTDIIKKLRTSFFRLNLIQPYVKK